MLSAVRLARFACFTVLDLSDYCFICLILVSLCLFVIDDWFWVHYCGFVLPD